MVLLDNFDEFRRKLHIKYFFVKKGEDNNSYNSLLHYPSKFVPPESSVDLNNMCFNIRDLLVKKLEEISAEVSDFKSNLSVGEQKALKELINNKSIVIKPADKNLGVTLMDLVWYMAECKRQLSDSKVYNPLPKEEVDPLLIRIKVALRKIIEKLAFYFQIKTKSFFYKTFKILLFHIFTFPQKLSKTQLWEHLS